MLQEELHSPLWERIWSISKILQCSPFSDEVLSLTLHQMDLIIQSWIGEHPEVEKEIMKKDTSDIDRLIKWADSLEGEARKKFLKRPGDFLSQEK